LNVRRVLCVLRGKRFGEYDPIIFETVLFLWQINVSFMMKYFVYLFVFFYLRTFFPLMNNYHFVILNLVIIHKNEGVKESDVTKNLISSKSLYHVNYLRTRTYFLFKKREHVVHKRKKPPEYITYKNPSSVGCLCLNCA
jgi:hypothetical protein